MKWLWDFKRKRKTKSTKSSNPPNDLEEDIINNTFQSLKANFREEIT
ncbi:MAG: hypothetical protein ACTSYD_14805 [Candidatus Heimdallarchaeaceae archaeon]